jgi:uridine kinase
VPSNAPHIILIDGESGVGKTTLALTMADELGATVVHLDDVHPGWGGLIAGRDAVIDGVLRPARRGTSGRLRRWDWEHNQPGIDVIVPASDVLIVEGCGISTAESCALADVTIWVSCDDEQRRERLAARDGDRFDEFTVLWEKQVSDHIAMNAPRETATVQVTT